MHFIIKYLDIIYMIIKIYIIIQNKKVTQFYYFFLLHFYKIGVCYKDSRNILIKYKNLNLIKSVNSMFLYILRKNYMLGNNLKNI